MDLFLQTERFAIHLCKKNREMTSVLIKDTGHCYYFYIGLKLIKKSVSGFSYNGISFNLDCSLFLGNFISISRFILA